MLSLALLFFLVFYSTVKHCDHLAWGRELWSMRFSCYQLFILHALNFALYLFLFVAGVVCDLCLWHSLDFSIYFFASYTAKNNFQIASIYPNVCVLTGI